MHSLHGSNNELGPIPWPAENKVAQFFWSDLLLQQPWKYHYGDFEASSTASKSRKTKILQNWAKSQQLGFALI